MERKGKKKATKAGSWSPKMIPAAEAVLMINPPWSQKCDQEKQKRMKKNKKEDKRNAVYENGNTEK